jgi:N-acetyl-anhydromuramyl-L-alanine amidase AmpD
MTAPRRITVHHLGGKAVADFDRPGAARRIKAIQKEHQDRRKWNDIAYHYVVDRGGRIWEGRPLSQLGAHAGSPAANEANIGVLILGNFDVQVPSGSQVSSLDRLVRALCRAKGIPRTSVYGHGEVRRQTGLAQTDCPGKYLRKWVEEFRRA